MSANNRMDCIDEKINIVNDKVDEIHTQVKELDQRMGTLESKFDLNQVLVMKRIDNMEDQISAFKTDQNLFNVTVEQKLGMLDQFGKDNASVLSVIEKVAKKVIEFLSSAKWLIGLQQRYKLSSLQIENLSMINFSANWEICQISWATSLILSLRKYLLHLMSTLKFS